MPIKQGIDPILSENVSDQPLQDGGDGDSYIKFIPSKTPLGKNLPDDIDSLLKDTLKDMDNDEALAASLKNLQKL